MNIGGGDEIGGRFEFEEKASLSLQNEESVDRSATTNVNSSLSPFPLQLHWPPVGMYHFYFISRLHYNHHWLICMDVYGVASQEQLSLAIQMLPPAQFAQYLLALAAQSVTHHIHTSLCIWYHME
jgi:hypothetical protein